MTPYQRAQVALKKYAPELTLYKSDKPLKKYYVIVDGRHVYFGAAGYSDYTEHQDSERRRRYLARATAIGGNWKANKYSPNNLAINVLW